MFQNRRLNSFANRLEAFLHGIRIKRMPCVAKRMDVVARKMPYPLLCQYLATRRLVLLRLEDQLACAMQFRHMIAHVDAWNLIVVRYDFHHTGHARQIARLEFL